MDTYAYYDADKRGVNFDGMLASLNAAAPGTIVVLHACCHNPTGYDITPAQWDQVIAVVKAKGLTAFLDMAYQGILAIASRRRRRDPEVCCRWPELLLSPPRSPRLQPVRRARRPSVLCSTRKRRPRAQPAQDRHPHQLLQPTHARRRRGGCRAEQPRTARLWEKELGRNARAHQGHAPKLVDGLKAAGVKQDMSFITQQIGMFSYSGLSKDQMVRCATSSACTAPTPGRMCVAALNSKNIDYVCQSIAKVIIAFRAHPLN